MWNNAKISRNFAQTVVVEPMCNGDQIPITSIKIMFATSNELLSINAT